MTVCPAAVSPPTPRADDPARAARTRLAVTGMDCGSCAATIEASLAGMPGVRGVRVSFGGGTAEVDYDPTTTDEGVIRGRIGALGYGVHDAAPVPTTGAPAGTPAGAPWVFDLSGLDCGDCARTVEAGVRRLPGVATADVSLAGGTLTVGPEAGLTETAVTDAVAAAGYRARARVSVGVAPPAARSRWWARRRVVETAIAALLALIGFVVERTGAPTWASVVPYLLAMAVAGYPVVRAAGFALRARRADMNLLMAVAALGAGAIGEWGEGATVLVVFAVGTTLQGLTIERTRRAIQALVRLAPQEATVRRDGGERRVPVAEVAVGEVVVVRPGERIPVDGVVTAGSSAVDQASITGESVPVGVGVGGAVYAASINGDGALTVRATKPAGDTTLARVIALVEEAQGSRAPAQAFVDRFAAVYTPIVIGAAALLASVVPLVAGDPGEWVYRALVLLVVACPCALVISTPVALVAAIGSASRRGVLFKGGAAIEALAAVRAVAFDKTGTLTAGRPAVTDLLAADGRPLVGTDGDALLAQAAAVERRASHPIAGAIVAAAEGRGITIPEAADARGIPGQGAAARVAGRPMVVGSRRLFAAIPAETEAALGDLEAAGKTAVLVGGPDGITGIVAVADAVRRQSAGTVAALGALGLKTAMLTGDNRQVAARIAGQVGVTDVRAGLLPEGKVAAVRDLQRTGPVAMVGDGVNDAPALATAEVGIAMGAAGTDVALEAADVALMSDDLARLPVAIRLARGTIAVIRQNIAASLLVKVGFLALAVGGAANLWLAVLADTGMALLVTANSLRLLRVAGSPPAADTGSRLGCRVAAPTRLLLGWTRR